MRQITVAWISQECLSFIHEEAEKSFPKETGGVLLGYWSQDNENVVITGAIGPGPKARHGKFHFVPDYDYHIEEVAKAYHASNRTIVYLGDWHSHPGNEGILSSRDRATLKRIACSPEARAPIPLMLLCSNGTPWRVFVWEWTPRQFGRLKFGNKVTPLKIMLFD